MDGAVKTLVELYDKEAVENVLGACIFEPEMVVYICDERDSSMRKETAVDRLFKSRGLRSRARFYYIDTSDPARIHRTLEAVVRDYPGCVFDCTGGKDLVLLAAGVFCREKGLPAYYIDTQRAKFVDLGGCEALKSRFRLPQLTAEDIFSIAGARLVGSGHFAVEELGEELENDARRIWPVVFRDPAAWGKLVGFFQAAGDSGQGLSVDAPHTLRVNRQTTAVYQPQLLHELEEVSGGLVKLVSVAPEVEGALDFIREASGEVRVSIAHTTADYDTAMAAFAAGASHVTHLFNAMPPFTHRAPGVVGAAFDTPDCRVELICDGVHIHPSVVRSVFKLFGADRVVLISDTMRAAGMADGDYTLGGQPVIKKGKHATLADGTLAGSVTDLMDCMRTAVSFGIPLADAVRAAAVNPGVSFRGIEGFLDRDNCRDIVAGHDLVMDALDSGEARLVLAEGCAAEGVPLIHGAIRGWYAQVAVVPPGSGLLRRLYRSGGGGGEDKSCLAFTPALCASLQTAEAVKLLCGRPGLPPGSLLMVDLLDQSYDVIRVESPARD